MPLRFSERLSLVLIVLLAVVPAVGLATVVGIQQRRLATEQAQDEAELGTP